MEWMDIDVGEIFVLRVYRDRDWPLSFSKREREREREN